MGMGLPLNDRNTVGCIWRQLYLDAVKYILSGVLGIKRKWFSCFTELVD